MNIIYILIIAFSMYATNTLANTLDLCKSTAETTRKMLPIKKDNFTTVTNVSCVSVKSKVRFVYMMEVSGIPPETIKSVNVTRDIKPNGLRQVCTDPDMRSMLNAFDIDYRYYTSKNTFIGSFLMESKECKGIRP